MNITLTPSVGCSGYNGAPGGVDDGSLDDLYDAASDNMIDTQYLIILSKV